MGILIPLRQALYVATSHIRGPTIDGTSLFDLNKEVSELDADQTGLQHVCLARYTLLAKYTELLQAWLDSPKSDVADKDDTTYYGKAPGPAGPGPFTRASGKAYIPPTSPTPLRAEYNNDALVSGQSAIVDSIPNMHGIEVMDEADFEIEPISQFTQANVRSGLQESSEMGGRVANEEGARGDQAGKGKGKAKDIEAEERSPPHKLHRGSGRERGGRGGKEGRRMVQ
ncbi:hypothetical protein ABKN59_011977 [Abortiporus biennis]